MVDAKLRIYYIQCQLIRLNVADSHPLLPPRGLLPARDLTMENDTQSTEVRRRASGSEPANDNHLAKIRTDPKPPVGKLSQAPAANDNASVTIRSPVRMRVPANDNAIVVTDDLPRPLPAGRGQVELVRQMLGERFRSILLGKETL